MGASLAEEQLDPALIDRVFDLITVGDSWSDPERQRVDTIEEQCLHDALNLDSTGAVGIARYFAYRGHTGRLLADPEQPTAEDQTEELNRVCNRMLQVKDRMFTASGKAMATARHQVVVDFIQEFHLEWEGKA